MSLTALHKACHFGLSQLAFVPDTAIAAMEVVPSKAEFEAALEGPGRGEIITSKAGTGRFWNVREGAVGRSDRNRRSSMPDEDPARCANRGDRTMQTGISAISCGGTNGSPVVGSNNAEKAGYE